MALRPDRNRYQPQHWEPPEGWPFLNIEPANNWRQGKPIVPKKQIDTTIRDAFGVLVAQCYRRGFGPEHLCQINKLGMPTDVLAIGVGNLRRQGYSWEMIANALGVARPNAYQRFAALVEHITDGEQYETLAEMGVER